MFLPGEGRGCRDEGIGRGREAPPRTGGRAGSGLGEGMEPRWRIELLGGLRAVQGDRAITRFRTLKSGELLAYLAHHRQRPHPREVLIELLWPECDLAAGRNRLSTTLSTLRHQLEPPGVPLGAVLQADRSTIQLNPAMVTTDAAE